MLIYIYLQKGFIHFHLSHNTCKINGTCNYIRNLDIVPPDPRPLFFCFHFIIREPSKHPGDGHHCLSPCPCFHAGLSSSIIFQASFYILTLRLDPCPAYFYCKTTLAHSLIYQPTRLKLV